MGLYRDYTTTHYNFQPNSRNQTIVCDIAEYIISLKNSVDKFKIKNKIKMQKHVE